MANMKNMLEKIGITIKFPPIDYSKLPTTRLDKIASDSAHQRDVYGNNQANPRFQEADKTYRQVRQVLDEREGLTLNL